ncbi:MAG: hypothetical protein QHH26_13170 [Armatimonadota bacterium]|nr:hypothetical protein [Armatimonadota bacterium]
MSGIYLVLVVTNLVLRIVVRDARDGIMSSAQLLTLVARIYLIRAVLALTPFTVAAIATCWWLSLVAGLWLILNILAVLRLSITPQPQAQRVQAAIGWPSSQLIR